MEPYFVLPKRQNMFNVTFIAACGGGAAAIFLYSLIRGTIDSTYSYTLVDKLATMLLFVFCLYGITWQFKGTLVYAVNGEGRTDGGADLIISHGSYKKSEVFCRIGVEKITAVIPLITKSTDKVVKATPQARQAAKASVEGKRKYRYSPDMLPTDVMIVCTDDLAITLSYDEKLYFLLRELSGIASAEQSKKSEEKSKNRKTR